MTNESYWSDDIFNRWVLDIRCRLDDDKQEERRKRNCYWNWKRTWNNVYINLLMRIFEISFFLLCTCTNEIDVKWQSIVILWLFFSHTLTSLLLASIREWWFIVLIGFVTNWICRVLICSRIWFIRWCKCNINTLLEALICKPGATTL